MLLLRIELRLLQRVMIIETEDDTEDLAKVSTESLLTETEDTIEDRAKASTGSHDNRN